MKKVLSLVLAGSMILSSMSMAFAATAPKALTDIADSDYKKAIETLVALDVVDGYEDGTFRPSKTISRAELAKLLVITLGYGDLVAGSKSNFSDTQGHWADSYVALAAGKGIVVGTGNGTFTPDRQVSYDEAITMVVRALGYTDASNELKGMSWPTNFKVKAAELDLTDDVAMTTAGADRGGVAQLLFNALEATLVTVNSDGDVVKTVDSDDENVELLSRIATYDSSYDVVADMLDADDDDYAGDIVDLTPYMYQTLKVYLNDDDEVVYVKSVVTETLTGTVTGVAGNTITLEDADGEAYDIVTDGNIVTYYNGSEDSILAADYAELLYTNGGTNAAAKITVIGTSDDAIVDGDSANQFVVEKATKGILVDADYVAGKSKISGDIGTIVLPEDSDGDVDLDAITVAGVDSLEDIVEGNVVIAYESIGGDMLKLVVVDDSIEGTVTKTNDGATTVYVDGTKYSLSKVANSVRYEEDLVAGDEGVFYLDNAGKIFAADTEGAELTDYALVLNTASGEYSDRMDGSVTDYPQIKLLTQDGETTVYDVLVTVEEDDLGAIAIDDVATYTDEEADVEDEDLVEVDGVDAIDFVPTLDKYTLVKYSVDEDGYIDELEVIATETETIDLDDIDSIASDDVVVFNTADEEVGTVADLEDNANHAVVYESGEIAVIVTDKIESADDVFGVINAVNYVLNDDGDKVVEFTAFVDGEEVTYLSDDSVSIGGLVKDTTTAQAFQFVFDGDEVTGIAAIADDADTDVYTGTATVVSSTKITIAGTTKYFASDVVVYIYDESEEEITIGDVSDLEEDCTTTAYVIDNTDSSRVGIVVQVQP